ncbi:MAG: hypothetical protein IJD43_04985 [Thermoguttaceae bacterium]|nr:hypothetical protein [Thermoguttaceae bacterium]
MPPEKMKEYGKYHTAVGNYQEVRACKDIGIRRSEYLTTFVWDVCKGVHEEFRAADCIYVEPSWLHGYQKFTKGTSAEGSVYKDYLNGLTMIIKELNLPTFVLCGEQVCKMLKAPQRKYIDFVFHKMKAPFGIWNVDGPLPFSNEIEAREYVARNFNTILDCSCGYGIIAPNILKHGKKAILTDINPDCISYVYNEFIRGKDAK